MVVDHPIYMYVFCVKVAWSILYNHFFFGCLFCSNMAHGFALGWATNGKKLALVEIVHDIWRARNYCVFDNRKANQTVFVVK